MKKQDELAVVVTGVGAIIGQGIVRSLRRTGRPLKIIGVDRSTSHPGVFLVDRFISKPQTNETSQCYLDYWRNIVSEEKVGLIIPGIEIDVLFFHKNRTFFRSLNVEIVLNNSRLIEISSNKWLFSKVLRELDYPPIPSVRPGSWAEALASLGNPPFLFKPLSGNGSRGIVRINNERDFEYWRSSSSVDWMLQKIVGRDDQEFTVGVFGLDAGRYIKPIIFRRRLSIAGNTQHVEVIQNHELIEHSVDYLSRRLIPVGPTNFQYRVDGSIPYLLEINPRFSSSNSLRTAFGYNEADMSISFFYEKIDPQFTTVLPGQGWRFYDDYVIYDRNNI